MLTPPVLVPLRSGLHSSKHLGDRKKLQSHPVTALLVAAMPRRLPPVHPFPYGYAVRF